MPSDKIITATLMDGTYIGPERKDYKKEKRYRLRGIRTKGDCPKVKIDGSDSEVLFYGSDAHFESQWIDVKRIGTINW